MYLRADPLHLASIEHFLTRIVRGELTAYVSLLVVDELFYRLLLALIKEHTGRNPLNVLREDLPGAISVYGPPITQAVHNLLTLPHFILVGTDPSDFTTMLNNITQFGLLPRDALHVTLMQRLQITQIASDDADFDRVARLERYWIVNPPIT